MTILAALQAGAQLDGKARCRPLRAAVFEMHHPTGLRHGTAICEATARLLE